METVRNITGFALDKLLDYIDKDPEKAMPRIMKMVDMFAGKDNYDSQRALIRGIINNKDSNWYQLMLSLFSDIDHEQLKLVFSNFIMNANLIGAKTQEELREVHGCNIPWAILMDPTSACNLHCTGCWAAEYGDQMQMSFETLDNIITQAKETGTYMFLYTGGEPLMRKDDIIALCEKHDDAIFSAFTNGTLIDEAFADEMLRVKNFVPAISIEGFEEATDSRRGKGTFKHIMRAVEILRERKLGFGASACYTSANYADIGSDAFFDALVDWGFKFCWLFTYMPIGKKAVPELMVTAEQREFMYHKIREFRDTKAIFTMDFWNDAEFAGGCIAGGRRYLHINANGDIEPCAFIHYSDSNVYDHTLLEAYKNPLFMQYHDGQPFNDNMQRPCPALDNPEKIVAIVNRSHAKSTDYAEREDVIEYARKCNTRAPEWAKTSEKLWAKTIERRPELLEREKSPDMHLTEEELHVLDEEPVAAGR